MKRKSPVLGSIVLMLIFGLLGFTKFSDNVRDVQVIGLFACGTCFGVGLTMLLGALRGKKQIEP